MPDKDKNKFQTEDAKKLQQIIDNFDLSNPLQAAKEWNEYIDKKNEELKVKYELKKQKYIETYGDDLYFKEKLETYKPDLSGSPIIIESLDGKLKEEQIVLTNFNFAGANFSNSSIENIYFNNCDFSNANFENATLEGSYVSSCNFTNADFKGFKSLQKIEIIIEKLGAEEVKKEEATDNLFSGNNFTKANFFNANLENTNFVNNNFTGAFIGKTASFDEISKLTGDQLNEKIRTKFDNLSPEFIEDFLPENDYISLYDAQKKMEGQQLSSVSRPQGLAFSIETNANVILDANEVNLAYYDRSSDWLNKISDEKAIINMAPIGASLDAAYTKDKLTFGYELNYTKNLNSEFKTSGERYAGSYSYNVEKDLVGYEFYKNSLSHNLYAEYKASNHFNFSLGTEIESQSPMKINQYYVDKQDDISYKPFANYTHNQISLGSINDLGPLTPAGETFRFDPANIGFSNYSYGTGFGSYIFNYAPSGPEIPTNFQNPSNHTSTENLEYRYTGITLSNVNTVSLNASAQFNHKGLFLGGNISYPIVSSFKITENEGSGVFAENNFSATRFNYVYYQANANGQGGEVIADIYQSNADIDILRTTNTDYKKPMKFVAEIGFKTESFSISAEMLSNLGSKLSYEDKTEVFVNGDKKAEFNIKDEQSFEDNLSFALKLSYNIPYKNLSSKKSDKGFTNSF